MRIHTRVLVIGGGVSGCAILYHLVKMGWTDVMLLERSELTSGSTWHAAGNLFSLARPSNAQRLQVYTINLYRQLEKEIGHEIGYHPTGGMHLAATQDEVTTLAPPPGHRFREAAPYCRPHATSTRPPCQNPA